MAKVGPRSAHVQLQRLKDWDRQALVRWKQVRNNLYGGLHHILRR